MRIAGILPSSFINGYGMRYVIFLQGCPHHCEGCQNPDTWDLDGGKEMKVEDIIKDIKKRKKLLDGITLSGGEPFLQQDECVKLLELLPEGLDVWIYTGFTYEGIKHTNLAKLADYIVDGKFECDKIVEGKLYGSSNQRIINVKKGTIEPYGERLQP